MIVGAGLIPLATRSASTSPGREQLQDITALLNAIPSWIIELSKLVGGAIAGVLATVLWKKIERRRLVSRSVAFFRNSHSEPPTVVIPTLRDASLASSEYIEFTTPLESILVYRNFSDVYRAAFSGDQRAKIYFSEAVPSERLGHNLVSIGGPLHNGVTKNLMEALRLPFQFSDHTLVDTRTQKSYESTLDNGAIVKEFALLVYDRNPWSQTVANVFLLAGCRAHGAIGTADYWQGGQLIRDLQRLHGYKIGDPCACVIEFDVHHIAQGSARYSNYKIHDYVSTKST